MCPILNKKRLRLLNSKDMKNYFKYAIGEIVLVVLGILIALIIRNWYQEDQLEQQIDQTAIQIIEDLTLDTATINMVIKHYEPREELYLKIMADSMSIEELKACDLCRNLVSLMVTFEPNVIGYSILKEFDTDLKTKKDSLIHDTKFFYSRFIIGIELMNDLIKSDIRDNLTKWKKEQAWYSNMILGVEDERYYEYVAHDQEFKNMAANFYLLMYKNYVNALNTYTDSANELAERWRELAEEES